MTVGLQLGQKRSNSCLCLQEHITKFLASQPAQECAADAATESHDNLSEQAAGDTVGGKRKRGAEDDSNAEPKVPKPSQKDNEFAVELSSSRQIRVSTFKGTLYVNIREWYEKDGELAPGKHSLLQLHSQQMRHFACETAANLISFLFLQLSVALLSCRTCVHLRISLPILHSY